MSSPEVGERDARVQKLLTGKRMTWQCAFAVHPSMKDKEKQGKRVNAEFKALSLKLHPDKCNHPSATTAMAALSELRGCAKKALRVGTRSYLPDDEPHAAPTDTAPPSDADPPSSTSNESTEQPTEPAAQSEETESWDWYDQHGVGGMQQLSEAEERKQWADGYPCSRVCRASKYLKSKYAQKLQAGEKVFEIRIRKGFVPKLKQHDGLVMNIIKSNGRKLALRVQDAPLQFNDTTSLLETVGLQQALPGCASIKDGVEELSAFLDAAQVQELGVVAIPVIAVTAIPSLPLNKDGDDDDSEEDDSVPLSHRPKATPAAESEAKEPALEADAASAAVDAAAPAEARAEEPPAEEKAVAKVEKSPSKKQPAKKQKAEPMRKMAKRAKTDDLDDLDEGHSKEEGVFVGSRLKVWDGDSNRFFSGVVIKIEPATSSIPDIHTVLYDVKLGGGKNVERLYLGEESWDTYKMNAPNLPLMHK